jgi:8-hydroxy-5-deazaflavin:NADPH oxidoreductase
VNLYSGAVPESPHLAAGSAAEPDGEGAARSPQPVAIVGATGSLGFGLAVRLASVGVPVVIGSRDRERMEQAAERARAAVPAGVFSAQSNALAVGQAQTVILSVPFLNQSETLASIAQLLRPGQLLIDASVPLAAAVSGEATRMLGVWQGSAAEQAREMVPAGVRVVSALHTVSAASLTNLDHPLEQDVLLCGDSHEDKLQAARLLQRIDGLRCVDCGRLEMSRLTESLTALMIAVKIRYTDHAGVHLTDLPGELWDGAPAPRDAPNSGSI